ncbi:T9SS type A sorting domain-containing protein [Dyadobacter sp. CY312]|uniref:T9SS type A sorting domain-containing protein n=1 Tax=Dyadobacter sp. CY312 TaxID=2907303 RepID=UPI001F3BBD23|nr:T9SS type A sorting domain-containing protein [Dyadobacter sp. CY312]MCE7044575.1 T9SS type A sorting domain-containing protein [Dyadobacter sp. CY312]
MKKIFFVTALFLGATGFLKVDAQYSLVSVAPSPLNVPIGGSTTGTFVFKLDGNGNGEGGLGAQFEVNVQAPDFGLSITQANITMNPSTGVPVVFTPVAGGNGMEANDFLTNYPIGTEFIVSYTVTSDGSGNVGDAARIGMRVLDNLAGTGGEWSNSPATLPVTLASFNVTKEGNKAATLSWKTTEETNSDYFEVQHSLNAKDWEAVGKVQSHNDGKAVHNYTFSYGGKTNGKNYFRLNMVDLDGTSTRSSVKSVTFENLAEEAVSFGPNPTSDYLKINLSDWSTVKSVSILDKMGRNVYSSGSKPENTISVRNFNSGLYVLKLTRNNGEVVVNKILVNK